MSLTDLRRCARGPKCPAYDPDKNLSAKLSPDTRGGFCGGCRKEHRGWYRASSDERWMGKVIEAIETVFTQRPTPPRPPKATLRDLLDLDSRHNISEEDTGLEDVLRLLDVKTLRNLEHFLYEHLEEAIDRQYCTAYHYTYLCSVVGMTAAHSSLPPADPILIGKPDTPSDEVIRTRRGYVVNLTSLKNALPFESSYIGSDRSENLKTPVLAAILAEALRAHYPRITDRAVEDTIEDILKISRSRQKRWRERMDDVGMTWRKFTDAQLQDVAIGKRRGPKPRS